MPSLLDLLVQPEVSISVGVTKVVHRVLPVLAIVDVKGYNRKFFIFSDPLNSREIPSPQTLYSKEAKYSQQISPISLKNRI